MKQENQLLLLQCLIVSAPVLVFVSASGSVNHMYTEIDAFMCVDSEFTETHPGIKSEVRCAMLCSEGPRCQAFRAPEGDSGGPCQLFVFDACSRSVRSDCGCSQRGRLFVKQRSGLPPGSLCPPDFGHGRCGVKYRAYSGTGNWGPSRLRCESDPGLVVMADAANLAELTHLDLVRNMSLSPQTSVWLSGLRQPGSSSDRFSGWIWASCGQTVSSDLWFDGQPENHPGDVVNIIYFTRPRRLSDVLTSDSWVTAVICECVSPFD